MGSWTKLSSARTNSRRRAQRWESPRGAAAAPRVLSTPRPALRVTVPASGQATRSGFGGFRHSVGRPLKGQRQGAQELRPFDEHRWADVEGLGHGEQSVTADRLPHRLEEDLASPADQPADDDAL